MKVVVPMAGRGSRLAAEGITTPKPLLPVAGRPMLAWALESLVGLSYSEMIFVALKAHDGDYHLQDALRPWVTGEPSVILLDGVTEGQLCTVLAAREHIDTDEDVLIASSDTYVVSDLREAIATRDEKCRGLISVSDMPGDQWSFARADERGRVVEVAEKVRISNHASTGIYYFSSGREFVEVADEIIHREQKTRGEYYVIPVYQKYVARGWWVGISKAAEMWDMGTPGALMQFESVFQCRKTTS